jgi:hypothetical protein
MPVRVSTGITQNSADDRYVKKAGDSMTGELEIDVTPDATALTLQDDASLKRNKKFYLDGE